MRTRPSIAFGCVPVFGRALAAVGLAAALAGPVPAWAADQPAALVLDYAGSNPALAPYSEIFDGARFDLGQETIQILHYRSCKTMKITGGAMVVGYQRMQNSGQVEVVASEQCPQEVAVKTAGVAGGVMLRAVAAPVVPPRLECVLVGPKKAAFTTMQVLDAGKPVATVPLSGSPKIALPAKAPALEVGKGYTLRLLAQPAKKGDKVAAQDVEVTVTDNAGGRGKMCMLRID